MAVGILKYGLPRKSFARLAAQSVSDAAWPLGPPKNAATLGDLTENDHLVLMVSSRSLLADRRGLACRVSALLREPPAIQLRYYRALAWAGGCFHRILTHNSRLLTRLPNARFVPHGGCFLTNIPEAETNKTSLVSIIASNKRDVVGQKLRHQIVDWAVAAAPQLEVFGRGYRPLENKEDGHVPHRYSVVIENSREPGYFTEKIIDSFLCSSVPIYWGAPDIEHFFDPRGMIVCRTEADLRTAVLAVNENDFVRRLPYLRENRRRALDYVDVNRNTALVLAREDEMQPARLLNQAA